VSDRRNPPFALFTPNPQELPDGELPLYPSEKSSLSISSPLLSSSCDFSFSDVQGSGDGGSGIEFIKGTFCARSGDTGYRGKNEELREFLVSLKEEVERAGYVFSRGELGFLWSFVLKYRKRIKSPYKLVRAYVRLMRHEKGWCGFTGHLLLEKRGGEIVSVSRVPHSCGSVVCEYCNVRQSRKRLAKVLPYLRSVIQSGKRLSFITLTVPNSFDISENVSALSGGFRRLYLMKLGERAWADIRREFARECVSYYRNLRKRGYSRAEARQKVEFQIELFRHFERRKCELERVSGKTLRFKDLFGFAVWKYELTYSRKSGFHSHFHGITDLLVPKLLLTVLSRRAGLGDVCDVRLVRGERALVELSKYETKAFELSQLDLEGKLLVELALMSFKRFRVWGEVQREEAGDDVQFLALPNVLVSLRGISDYLSVFNEVRNTQKAVKVRVGVSNETFFTRQLQSFEVPVRFSSFEVEAEVRPDGEMYLNSLLEDEGMRDFLLRCVRDFAEFCWFNSKSVQKGMSILERFKEFEVALSKST